MYNKNFCGQKSVATSADFEFAKQFAKMFNDYYLDSLEKGARGFCMDFSNPKTHEPFFKFEITGESYEALKNPKHYADIVTSLIYSFISSFEYSSYFNNKED